MKIHNETTTAKSDEINHYGHDLHYNVFNCITGEVIGRINVRPGGAIPQETNEIEYIHVW